MPITPISNGESGSATRTSLNQAIAQLNAETAAGIAMTNAADAAAQAALLTTLAPKASPALTGNPTAPTQAANDNSTKIATTAYADAKVADAINDGVTAIAPSQNAVFDGLALKQPLDADLTLLAAVTPTTKGDILAFTGAAWNRIAAGSNTQVLTADSAQTAGVKWAAGGGSGTILTGHTLWVDAVNGNDTNAHNAGDYDFAVPFLTIEGALAQATSGDTIYVRPGDYAVGNTILADGVDWYFEAGAVVTRTLHPDTPSRATLVVSSIVAGDVVFSDSSSFYMVEIVDVGGDISNPAHGVVYCDVALDTTASVRDAICEAIETGTATTPNGATNSPGTASTIISATAPEIRTDGVGSSMLLSVTGTGVSLSGIVAGTNQIGNDVGGIWDDLGGSMTSVVSGYGVFVLNALFPEVLVAPGAVSITGSGSLTINAISITCNGAPSPYVDGKDAAAILGTGIITSNVEDIIATGSSWGILWNDGLWNINSKTITSESVAAIGLNPASNSGDLFLKSNLVYSSGAYGFWQTGGNASVAAWLDIQILKSDGSYAAYATGTSKTYLKAFKVFGKSQLTAGRTWYTVQKWTPIQNGDICLDLTDTAVVVAEILDVDTTGFTATLVSAAGTSSLYLTILKTTLISSTVGVVVGGGTVHLMDTNLDTSANSGVDAISITSGEINVTGCSITSHSSKKDINSSGGTVNVTDGLGSGVNGRYKTTGTITYLSGPPPTIIQNAQTVDYTLVATDAGKHIYHASGAGAGDTYTIPANSSVPFAIGTAVTFVNLDSNSLEIAITTDTLILAGTGNTAPYDLAENGVATALKVDATTWILSGTGLS